MLHWVATSAEQGQNAQVTKLARLHAMANLFCGCQEWFKGFENSKYVWNLDGGYLKTNSLIPKNLMCKTENIFIINNSHDQLN